MGRVTSRQRTFRIRDGDVDIRPDTLVVEEPLEIRLNGQPLSVTMRTPGYDFELTAGFLVSEGVVNAPKQIEAIRYCAGTNEDGENTYNVLDVALADGVEPPDTSLQRNFYTTSSCGLCGKASLDAVHTVASWEVRDDPLRLEREIVACLPGRLREAQRVFERTGGLHAAGLFSADGEPLCVREDVGRHNAVDKLVGWALLEGHLPVRGSVLMVSGRASFELAQKTLMAGAPAMAAVSAPSSLAVELAADAGLTLIGFLRGSSMNVYAGAHRLGLHDSAPAQASR